MTNEIKNLSQDNISYIWRQILKTFVLKVDGKELSTNDLTDELLGKINKVITNENFNGSYNTLSGLPTINSIEIKNNVTLEDLGITALIGKIFGEMQEASFQIVSSLPTVDDEIPPKCGCFYLVKGIDETNEGNYFDEYIWITKDGTNYDWEKIGSIPNKIDLSEYVTESQIEEYTETELNTIIDGINF